MNILKGWIRVQYLADVVFNLTLGEALESATLRPYLEYHVVPGIHTVSQSAHLQVDKSEKDIFWKYSA